jgi:transcriptional regulator with XRE-family HTH domain
MDAKIDTKWFVDRLAARDMSQRALAKLMGLDPAAVSLMFRGKRRMSMAEAAQLATILDVAPSEMFERAGIAANSHRKIKLAGVINARSEIVFFGKGAHDYVEPPGDVAPETVAFQCKTAGTELDRMDGMVYFVDHVKSNPAQFMNTFCACATKAGPTVVAQVRKGYQRGTYNLMPLGGGPALENTEVAWASPITWAKFPS